MPFTVILGNKLFILSEADIKWTKQGGICDSINVHVRKPKCKDEKKLRFLLFVKEPIITRPSLLILTRIRLFTLLIGTTLTCFPTAKFPEADPLLIWFARWAFGI